MRFDISFGDKIMKKMTIGLLTAAAITAMLVAGSALTFKKG